MREINFWKYRDQDFEKIPGIRDITGSCMGLPLTMIWNVFWVFNPNAKMGQNIHICLRSLACEDVNSKLVEVFTVADVDAEKHVDDSSVQIWNLKFGHKVTDDHPSLTLIVRLRIVKCCVFWYMTGHFSKRSSLPGIHCNMCWYDIKLYWMQDQRISIRPCGLMDKAPDFGSGDCRFESCHGRSFWFCFLLFQCNNFQAIHS